MAQWQRVVALPLDLDLRPLLRHLQQRRVPVQVTEEAGEQVVWVPDPALAVPVAELIVAWREGRADLAEAAPIKSAVLRPRLRLPWQQLPVTLSLLVLSLIGYAVVSFDSNLAWTRWLTFQDLRLVGENRVAFEAAPSALARGEIWRLLTPAMLHFGILHLIFNGVWLWEFGRRIERRFGSVQLLALVVTTALMANLLQYGWSGPGLFGGMSGVVYGLLGYLWLRQRQSPHPITALPPAIFAFFLFWLALGMTGMMDAFVGGRIANAAHLGGLLGGLLLAALHGWRGPRRE